MDTISNMFTTIKNAQDIRKPDTLTPFSNIKMSILKILKESGYISEFQKKSDDGKDYINIVLNYDSNKPAITKISRVSKPGRRIYIKHNQIPKVLNGFGISILSTPQGILSGSDAKKNGVGGELIAEIW